MAIQVTTFMVSLVEVPRRGPAKILIEVDYDVRNIINYAASVCHMSAQQFMRAVLFNAAKKVLDEAGKQYDDSVGGVNV